MTTTPAGIPYPSLSDTPDVPFWMQQLAEAVDDLVNTVVTASSIVTTPGAGWSITTANGKRVGRVIQVTFTFSRTGAAVAAGTTGNITNQTVGTVDAAWRPIENAALSVRDAGGIVSGYLLTDGTLGIGAVHADINTGDTFTLSGTFIKAG